MRLNIGGFTIDDPEKMRRYLTKPLAVEPRLTDVRHDIYGKRAADQEQVKEAGKEYHKRMKRRALMNKENTIEEVESGAAVQDDITEMLEQLKEVHENKDWVDEESADEIEEKEEFTTINDSGEFSEADELSENQGETEKIDAPKSLPSKEVEPESQPELRISKKSIQEEVPDWERRLEQTEESIVRNTKVNKEEKKCYNEVVEEASTDYSKMDIKVLYEAVRIYMKNRGVTAEAVNIDELNSRFGAEAIKRLRRASYLIVIGKGVTITDV